MARTNGEILRDLRKKNRLTMEELGKKLGTGPAFINNMEKGTKPIPESMLEKMILILGADEKDIAELRKNIIEGNLPKALKKTVFKNITDKTKIFKHKVYKFDTDSEGIIDIHQYREEQFMLDADIKESSLIIEVMGKGLEPFFYEGDRLLFESENFQNWTKINKKLIAFKFGEKYMIRKVKFDKKKPYLLAIDAEVYEDIDVSEHEKELLYIGQLSRLLDRNLKNMIFE